MPNTKNTPAQMSYTVVPAIPMIKSGDDLSQILIAALENSDSVVEAGDILVIAQKIVSKAEGRLIRLQDVTVSEAAQALALVTDKEPELCQLILDETDVVMRKKPGVTIVRHKLGHVGANAGIDQSNVEHKDGESALLLPVDPDNSAMLLHKTLSNHFNCHLGVIIADSMNRPWRLGTLGAAIGCAGVQVLNDLRGGADMFGRELKVSMVNTADSITAAATLLMGETTEGTPVVLVKGLTPNFSTENASNIMRPLEDDMFQ